LDSQYSERQVERHSRPTTHDLAKAAGVSRATVDRVLNGRAKVKQETVDRVNLAIEQLGFVRNLAAANLAKGTYYRFLFVLPQSGDLFLDEILERIEEANHAFASEMIWAEVQHIDENDPHGIAAFLSALSKDSIDGVAIMAPESPQLRDSVTRLKERGIEVLPFISNQNFDQDGGWVGIDNIAAGATAATLLGRFCRADRGTVLLVSETIQSRDSLERRFGFDDIINTEFPYLRPLPTLETYGSQERAQEIIATTVANNPDIVGVYVLSSEARAPLEALFEQPLRHKPTVIAHERTEYTERELSCGNLDAVITQDPGHLVRSAIRKLRAGVDGRETLASQERIRVEILIKQNL
jgi:LacI family transcriptional regulator|tara:strand:+ start:490 stop:1551 length:1062 start_codon:yes stop_codon:yes gene_type:complete